MGVRRIWWYPEYKSILVKTVVELNSSSNSSMVGMGKRSRIVAAFKAL